MRAFPKSNFNANCTSVLLALLILVGALLRILTCYWGYPYQLHPDEGTIVNSALDIIRRFSYEPSVYNRPNHFEIKLCALIFQVSSYILYHTNAVSAFSEHRMTFFSLQEHLLHCLEF